MSGEGPWDRRQVRRAYETWHERFGVDRESDAPWHRLVKEHVDLPADVAGKRILEVACGRGGFACWLASRVPAPACLVAADFARSAVFKGRRFARDHDLDGIGWVVTDVVELGIPAGSLDTVFCCETIEHVSDPPAALRELARVLRPAGRLYLTTPNYLGLMGLHRLYRLATGRPVAEEGQPLSHALLLPRTVRWVRAAGLEVVRVVTSGQYLPWPGRPPMSVTVPELFESLTRWFGLHTLVVAVR